MHIRFNTRVITRIILCHLLMIFASNIVTTTRAKPKAVNYCSAELCNNNKKNIACNNNGKFGPKCPGLKNIINLSKLSTLIVTEHNRRRNQIAGGNIPRFNGAQRMATMSWNKELAKMASFNVKQCVMKHDACRNTFNFRFSGQNLAMLKWNSTAPRKPNLVVKKFINNFFAEYKNADMSVIRNYKNPSNNNKMYGHFTEMVIDANTHVGCAASQFFKNGYTHFLMACNYARINIIGQPVYGVGPTGGGCKAGRNAKFKNLCAPKEKYAINVA